MADEKHLEILLQGIEKWNEWRESNPKIQPNLTRANLSWADLREANLARANLSGASLRVAKLSQADLSRANLSEADLSLADLSFADLSQASLRMANLCEANLHMTCLNGADLKGANIADLGSSYGAPQGFNRLDKLFHRDSEPPKGADLERWQCYISNAIPRDMPDEALSQLEASADRATDAAEAGDAKAWNEHRRRVYEILAENQTNLGEDEREILIERAAIMNYARGLDREASAELTSFFLIARIVAIGMLVWGISSIHPADYYKLLRFIVCGVAAYGAYRSWLVGQRGAVALFSCLAILFNPFLPFVMNKQRWAFWDGLAAAFLAISVLWVDMPPIMGGFHGLKSKKALGVIIAALSLCFLAPLGYRLYTQKAQRDYQELVRKNKRDQEELVSNIVKQGGIQIDEDVHHWRFRLLDQAFESPLDLELLVHNRSDTAIKGYLVFKASFDGRGLEEEWMRAAIKEFNDHGISKLDIIVTDKPKEPIAAIQRYLIRDERLPANKAYEPLRTSKPLEDYSVNFRKEIFLWPGEAKRVWHTLDVPKNKAGLVVKVDIIGIEF